MIRAAHFDYRAMADSGRRQEGSIRFEEILARNA
jgi:hypothetical protein